MNDPTTTITESLVDMLRRRAAVGLAKYGTSLDRTDLTLEDWLQHQLEELLDGAGYAMAALRQLRAAPARAAVPEGRMVPSIIVREYLDARACYDATLGGNRQRPPWTTKEAAARLIAARESLSAALDSPQPAGEAKKDRLPKALCDWLLERELLPEVDEDGSIDVDSLIEMLNTHENELATSAPADYGKTYSIDADPDGIRERVVKDIHCAIGEGQLNISAPPTHHWLENFWNLGKALTAFRKAATPNPAPSAPANAPASCAAPPVADFRGSVEMLLEAFAEEVPKPDCHCHRSPPCSDCIEWAHKREAIAYAHGQLAKGDAPFAATPPAADIDSVSLAAARMVTPEGDPQRRAKMQCAIRDAIESQLTPLQPRQPDGYAYRYPSQLLSGGTEIRFNGGQEVNGSKPIEAVPYYLGTPDGDWVRAGDVQLLVDQIDEALNGKTGRARRASLCDIASQVDTIARRSGPILPRVHDAQRDAPEPRFHSGGIVGLLPGEVPAILLRGDVTSPPFVGEGGPDPILKCLRCGAIGHIACGGADCPGRSNAG